MTPKQLFALVKNMHEHFGISNVSNTPCLLSEQEQEFRTVCLREEIDEYVISGVEKNLSEQLDALVDLVIFAVGTAERQGLTNFDKAVYRVMRKNMLKEVAKKASDSKRNFEIDLVKPAHWRAPYLGDLVLSDAQLAHQPARGIIVLDGPDHCGKSTLAEYLARNYNAHVIHSTWSKELEPCMEQYINGSIDDAIEISEQQLVVLDRSWISDYVYDKVYRDSRNLKVRDDGSTWHNAALRKVQNAGGIIVMCVPQDTGKCLAEFNANKDTRAEMYLDNMEKIHAEYKTLIDEYTAESMFIVPKEEKLNTSALLTEIDSIVCYYDYLKVGPVDGAVFQQAAHAFSEFATQEYAKIKRIKVGGENNA